MPREFRSADKGMKVMTSDGDVVGTIENVSNKRAYVKPDTGLSDSLRRQLDWTDENQSTYELDHDAVDQIKDDGIHLKSNF